jgi:transcriptional regulator
MLSGIAGFEIAIERMEGKFKLSQNRDAVDRRRVIAALSESAGIGDRALAEFMSRHAAPSD